MNCSRLRSVAAIISRCCGIVAFPTPYIERPSSDLARPTCVVLRPSAQTDKDVGRREEGIRIHQQIRRYPPAALEPCAKPILWQGSTHVAKNK